MEETFGCFRMPDDDAPLSDLLGVASGDLLVLLLHQRPTGRPAALDRLISCLRCELSLPVSCPCCCCDPPLPVRLQDTPIRRCWIDLLLL